MHDALRNTRSCLARVSLLLQSPESKVFGKPKGPRDVSYIEQGNLPPLSFARVFLLLGMACCRIRCTLRSQAPSKVQRDQCRGGGTLSGVQCNHVIVITPLPIPLSLYRLWFGRFTAPLATMGNKHQDAPIQ